MVAPVALLALPFVAFVTPSECKYNRDKSIRSATRTAAQNLSATFSSASRGHRRLQRFARNADSNAECVPFGAFPVTGAQKQRRLLIDKNIMRMERLRLRRI